MEAKEGIEMVDVAIMHVINTGKLWVSEPAGLNMSEQRDNLNKIEEKLTRLLRDSFEMPSNLPVNKLIAVKNAETNRWHRGELLSPYPTNSSCRVRVFLVDHGAFLTDVKTSDLQILPKEMHQLPHQAFVTCLYGLIPIAMNVHLEDIHDKMHYEESVHWTPASETFVQGCVNFSTCALLRGIVYKERVIHGEIFLNIPGSGLISLNKELVKNNFAIYSEEKYQKVIEREAILAKEMAEKKALLSKADKIEEKCSIPKDNLVEIKHVLMKDFLREYASKKLERQENTAYFLKTIRHNSEMEGLKEDDEERREALRGLILTSPVKTLGRGSNLKILKENTSIIQRGRGLTLLREEKQPAPLPLSGYHQKTASSFTSLLDLLSVRPIKNTEQQKDTQTADNAVNNSVLSLGYIPAGFPLNFEESFVIKNKMNGVSKKTSKSAKYAKSSQDVNFVGRGINVVQQNEGSAIRTNASVQVDRNYANRLQNEKLLHSGEIIDKDVAPRAKSPCSILDPKFLLESTNDNFWSFKSKLENVCTQRKETEVSSENKSAEISSQVNEGLNLFHGNRILKMIRNHSKNSPESPHLKPKSAEVVAPQQSYSNLKSESDGNKLVESTSVPVKKIHHLTQLRSQSDDPSPLLKEEALQGLSSSDCKEESEIVPEKPKKCKTMNPLQSLLDIMRKKNRPSTKDNVENTRKGFEKHSDKLQSLDSADGDSKVKPGNDLDVKVDSSFSNLKRFEDLNNITHEAKKKKGHDSLNKGPEIKDLHACISSGETEDCVSRSGGLDAKHRTGDTCPDTASPPEKMKAAIHMLAEAMRDMENRGSGKSSMDLTSLRKELDAFSERVIQQSRYNTSATKDETPFSSETESEQHSSACDTAATPESFVKKDNNLSDEATTSSYREPSCSSPVMTTIAEIGKPSTQLDSVNIPSERISDIQNNVVAGNSPVLNSDKNQVESSEILECSDELSSSKSFSGKIHSRIVSVDESSSKGMQCEFNFPLVKLPPNADLFDCSTESNQSMPKPVPSNTFDLLRMFSQSKHLKEEKNDEADLGKGVNESKEPSDGISLSENKISPLSSGNSITEDLKNKLSEASSTKSLLTSKQEEEIEPEVKDVVENAKACDKSPEQHSELTESKESGPSELSASNLEKDSSCAIVQESQSLFSDEYVSRKISSCAKILSRIEAIEKSKTYEAIKDEGVPMNNLSARLPLCAAQDIFKSKGSTLSLSSNCSSVKTLSHSSNAMEIKALEVLKQKTLEPEVVTPSPVTADNLPPLLRNSQLSGPAIEDCLFTAQRLKMCRILVRGNFLAQRITTIAQATFTKSLHMALSKMGFRDPMRIQTYAWPALMRGHNLVMVNPPRSGKSLAYLVPIISFMLSPDLYAELPAGNGPLVLILGPSSNVVLQLYEFCRCLLSDVDSCIKVIPTYGGIENDQILSLLNGCHILISTPRCFIRLLRKDKFTTNLDRLCHLVFDEADTLMKLFFPEVKEILRECRSLLQRRARFAAESNPSGGADSYAMVKLVAAAKSWCPQMESFVTNIVEKPLLCIGSYLEAAVYARLKPKLHLVGFGVKEEKDGKDDVHESSEKKIMEIDDVVLHIIKRRLGLYKIVVACETEVDVQRLAPKIKELGADVLEVHEKIHHVDIADALDIWMCSLRPGAFPVLLVSDEVLPEVNIGDAEHLVHVGVPSTSKTQFGLRFSTLMDNYRDIFDKDSESGNCKSQKNCFVDIVVDINKQEAEISGLIGFLQRLGMEIPSELDAAASRSLLNKEKMKKKDVELCPDLKSFGECSSSGCNFRHFMSADLDKPTEGTPTFGEVSVKILSVLDASRMSVRLLEHTGHDGTKTLIPDNYYYIASDLARYFGKPKNRIPHGNPSVGDMCAFESEINLFHRARVEEIFYSNSEIKNPVGASINLIDRGIKIKVRTYKLLYIPDDLKEYPAQAKELIVCHMVPRDLDSSWSKAACVKVAEWIEEEAKGEIDGKVIIGTVVLALGDTLWVDPLECREWLTNHKTNVIHLSLRLNLLRAGLAIDNPSHVQKLRKLCEVAGLSLSPPPPKSMLIEEDVETSDVASDESMIPETKLVLGNPIVLPDWEILISDKLVEVNVLDVENPYCFRVQKVTTSEKLKDLSKEIQLWISDVWKNSLSKKPENVKEHCVGSFCLGYFEADKCWNRAKVISLMKTSASIVTDDSMESEKIDVEKEKLVQYKLYFVDYGDTATVSSSEVAPMPDNFITQLPFQAIECGLMGLKPIKEESEFEICTDSNGEWDDEVSDAFYELCREGDDLDIYRPMLAKVFGTEGMGIYGGTKYSVILYDKGGTKSPTCIGDLLVKRGLAISCQVIVDGEADDEMDDDCQELESHWIGEGALLPFTPALYSSTASELGSTSPSVEDSNCAALVPAKSSWSDLSETKQSSVDDDDADSYDIVMSDDEVKLYEERLRSLLGIPPRPDERMADGVRSPQNEESTAIEKTSSYGRLTSDGGDLSSFTSFEDLGRCVQQSHDRFEEILDENGEVFSDLKEPNQEKEGIKTDVEDEVKSHASSEVNLKIEDVSCESDPTCTDVEGKVKSHESSEVNLKMEDVSCESDPTCTTQNKEEREKEISIGMTKKPVDGDIIMEVVEIEKISNESDSYFSPAEETYESLDNLVPSTAAIKETKAKDCVSSMDVIGDAVCQVVEDLEFHSTQFTANSSLNVEGNVSGDEHVCDKEGVSENAVEDACAVSFVGKENEAQDEPAKALLSDHSDPVECTYVKLSSELTEVNTVEEEDVGMATCTREWTLVVNEVTVLGTTESAIHDSQGEHDVLGDEKLFCESTFKGSGGEGNDTGIGSSKQVDSDNAESSGQIASEFTVTTVVESKVAGAENLCGTIEEELNVTNKEGANTTSDVTDVEEDSCNRSMDEESFCQMPDLIQAKTPSVKWAQSKREIILKVDLPNMNRYNIYWESNSKLWLFASSDTANISHYVLEMELWAPVDVKNSEHAAVSDNTVKVIMPKALAYMEWPRLLLATSRPLWLSVDFDLMEYDLEDMHVEAPAKLVHYASDDEIHSEEEEDERDNGVRCEEVNYDPYDPLS